MIEELNRSIRFCCNGNFIDLKGVFIIKLYTSIRFIDLNVIGEGVQIFNDESRGNNGEKYECDTNFDHMKDI